MPSDKRRITGGKLRSLWKQYARFRKPQLAPSTYKRDYTKISRRLERMKREAPKLDSAISIRDWLLANYSHETARRTIVQFNACCKWAMYSDLIENNPFAGITSQLPKRRRSPLEFAAFTAQERDRIIQEFDAECPWAAPWVKFLFWTGCRPEEAAALRWRHVAGDHTEMFISEAFPVDMKEPQATKNYKSTRFPCNARLQRLLRSQRPQHWSRDGLVFLSPRLGKRFDYHNFQSRHWKPLVMDLCDRGAIAFYLSQYHARHTFITEGLKADISVPDMAYLCRVSTAVLYKHYVGRTRSIVVPEF